MNENSIGNWKTMVDNPANGASLGHIDQYELVRELGGGGFGTVYLAKDTVSGIDVAVKGLPPLVRHNREELENIRWNFALVSRLHHPNIAAALTLHPVAKAVYNDRTDAEKLRVFNGDTLVVMQYAPGVTLSQWRKQFPENKVPLDQALEITRQVASALDYAHREKILHRDIKPANVMIETDAAGKVTARVLDFGLAAEIRSSMGRVSQQVCDTSGTRPYMAPEQWLGKEQGKETDLYALAVLFYELVTGKVPFASVFDTGDPVVMMNVVGREEPELISDLPKSICAAILKALAKKREDRFDSCVAFVDALAGHGSNAATSGKFFGKIAAIGLLALGLVGGVWYWQDAKAKEEARIVAEQKVEADRKAAEEARIAAEKKAEEEKRIREELVRKMEADRKAAEKQKSELEQKKKEKEARLAAEKAKQEAEDCARKAEDARIASERRVQEELKKPIEQMSDRKVHEKERKEKKDAAHIEKSAARDKEDQESKQVESLRIAREIEERKAKESAARKRKLYTVLAKVETSLEKYKAFEYFGDIQNLYDSLLASYKSTKNAIDANDFDTAIEMAEGLLVPQEKIDALLPVVKKYYSIRDFVDEARKGAMSAEASRYAKESFDKAEQRYKNVKSFAEKKDFVSALRGIEGLVDLYKAAKNEAETNPEAIYQKGLVARQAGKYSEAFSYFTQAAKKRHPAALANLGLCYLKGQGVNKDEVRAFNYFHDASKLNYAQAQYFLAGCYAKAIGVKYEKEPARVWMAIARANGNKAAGDFLAKAGWVVLEDEVRAINEMLNEGKTSVEISTVMKSALQHIVDCKGGE